MDGMNEAVQNRRYRKRRFIILKIISQSPLILLETWKFLSYNIQKYVIQLLGINK